jgi:peptide/nickel transport system permease protein
MAIIERPRLSAGNAGSLWRALLWPRREAGPRRAARVPWVPIVHHFADRHHGAVRARLAPYSPIDQTLRDKLLPPAWVTGGSDKYLLGTDAFGRDILSRLIYGARVSLLGGAAGA